MTTKPSETGDPRVAGLFAEYLAAEEEGRDLYAEVIARAGDAGPALAARIQLHQDLRTLSADIASAPAEGGAADGSLPASIGRFQILARIGAGGIGQVFLAHDPLLARRIALKVLDKRATFSRNERAWVLNEARSLARLDHQGVVRVFEIAETADHDTIAMEHLSGPSLEEVIAELCARRSGELRAEPKRETRLLADRLTPYSGRVAVLAKIAGALAYCHDRGILHRDVKPSNVLFDKSDEPRLIDFGLAHLDDAEESAKLYLTQELVGTPAYIAPEQVELGRTGADPRSDQFSFCVVAYELLALVNPFDRDTRTRTLDAITVADPPPLRSADPAIPSDLARAIHHGLQLDPAARYPGMAALEADLLAILANRPISVAEPGLLDVARRWLRRHRRAVRTTAIVIASLLVLGVGTWVVSVTRARGRLVAELGALDIESFASTDQFEAAIEPLTELAGAAEDFDAGLLRSALWGPLSDDVSDAIHRWSRRLNAVHAADRAEHEAEGTFQGLAYHRLFIKEEQLCPECTYNREERSRGQVLYPTEAIGDRRWELARLTAVRTEFGDVQQVFRKTEAVAFPTPGVYLLRIFRGAGERPSEQAFSVPDGWPPPRRLEFRPPRQEFLDRSIEIATQGYPSPGLEEALELPAFRVLEDPVTVADFERFLADTGWRPAVHVNRLQAEVSPPGDPAREDLESALRFASWAGGRLPHAAELCVAARELVLDPSALQALACGEHVLDLPPTSNHREGSIFRYDRYAPDRGVRDALDANTDRGCPSFPPDGGLPPARLLSIPPTWFPCFRLVFP